MKNFIAKKCSRLLIVSAVFAAMLCSGLLSAQIVPVPPPTNGDGSAYISNVVATSPTPSACVQSTINGNNQFWDVAQGNTYLITLSGVTDCANGGTDATIEVIVKNSVTGNSCATATYLSDGVYEFEFTMPTNACATFPIVYCTSNCSPSTGMFAQDLLQDGLGHLRSSYFDGNCDKTATDNDCGTNCSLDVQINGETDFCSGQSTQLCASAGVSWEWSNGSTEACITVTSEGTYSVVAYDANGCTGEASADVSENTPPTVEVTATGSTTVCSPTCVVLTASGANSYVWSPNGEITDQIDACDQGSYSVVGTDENGCTSASDPVDITVNLPPVVEVSVDGPTTACSPSCVTLTASGAETYVWAPNGEITDEIQACATGEYTVTGTDLNGCTSASESVSVTINPPPVVTVSATGSTTVCSPACVTLTASGATSYVWSPNGQITNSIQACATGSYSVTGTDLNGCTDASDPISITITPTPTCSLSVPSTLPICGLGGNTLSAVITGATTSIVWQVTSSNGSWQLLNGQGTSSITYKAGTSGSTGTFNLTVTNNGCSSTCSVTFGSSCQEYCGYTQGFWGGNGKMCDGTTKVLTAINNALTSGGPIYTGGGTRKLTILTTEGTCLNTKMPAGTTPASLPVGNVTCATATGTYLNSGKFKSVILGQTIALMLNVRSNPALGNLALTGPYFTTYNATSCTNGTAKPGTKTVKNIPQSVLNCLGANNTVNGLITLANQALAEAIPAACTCTTPQINEALNAINTGFDNCKILAGFGNSSAGVRIMDPGTEPVQESSDEFEFAVMPNPVSGVSTLFFTARESAVADCELFGMNGQRVQKIFQQQVEAGNPYGFEINSSDLLPGIYFVRVTIGSETSIQKIVVIRQ